MRHFLVFVAQSRWAKDTKWEKSHKLILAAVNAAENKFRFLLIRSWKIMLSYPPN
jgi:hypothetical protein